MVPADYTLQRLRAVIAQAKALQCSEFPYDHSQQALERVLAHFRLLAETMESLGDNGSTEVVQQQCAIATRDIHVSLPLLGFILRSTNARNAFEFHRPFLRLAQDVLRPHADGGHVDTCLVMSSEWDFVPYIYHDIPMVVAVKLYEMGRLSSGAAAEMAGVPKPVFLGRLADYGVATFGLTGAQLDRETRLA